MKRIVIEVSGGVVQEVYADEPAAHTICDYDAPYADECNGAETQHG